MGKLDISNLLIDYQLKKDELLKEQQFLQQYSNDTNEISDIDNIEELFNEK